MEEFKQIIVMRKDLNMRKGKMVALDINMRNTKLIAKKHYGLRLSLL